MYLLPFSSILLTIVLACILFALRMPLSRQLYAAMAIANVMFAISLCCLLSATRIPNPDGNFGASIVGYFSLCFGLVVLAFGILDFTRSDQAPK